MCLALVSTTRMSFFPCDCHDLLGSLVDHIFVHHQDGFLDFLPVPYDWHALLGSLVDRIPIPHNVLADRLLGVAMADS